MGSLQAIGLISGFGQGLQQGFQQMQQTMGQETLLRIREEMEQNRIRETFAHEEGLLNKKHDWDVEAADTAHSRQLDLNEQQQDAVDRRARIARDAARTDASTEAERQKELEEIKQKNRINELVVREGYSQQAATRKAVEERAEKARERKAEEGKTEKLIGRDIVVETIRNQRPHAGSSAERLSPDIASRAKDLDLEIEALLNEKKSIRGDLVMKDEKKKAALDETDRKIAEVRNKKNKLLGRPEEQVAPPSAPVDISQFDKFKGASPY